MKYYPGLLALLISASSYGQKDKLSFTICPLAAADLFSFPTIQGGVEYRFTPNICWYNEFGVEYARSFIGLPDSVILRPHGIKAKTELRYYFHSGTAAGRSVLSGEQYVAINGFLTSDTHYLEGPIDYNIAFEREKTEAKGGFSTTANLTAGVRLFYRL